MGALEFPFPEYACVSHFEKYFILNIRFNIENWIFILCNFMDLISLAAMAYDPLGTYHLRKTTRMEIFGINTKWFSLY